jgi:isopenicillin N synthase-like dioxygenase
MRAVFSFECFTILWQQPGMQALQVRNTRDEWVDAPPIPGTLVINLGDQFARWTNDVFKSTVHRAANRSGAERYSIPLFFGVDYDVLLEVGRQVTFPHPVALKDLLANRQLRKCRAATTV